MYCHYYGFSQRPFDITPDPKFFYLSSSQQELLGTIMRGIHERLGLLALIGELGIGKTTLLKTVVEKLPATTKAAHIFSTNLTFKQMLLAALVELGIIQPHKNVSSSQAILFLNEFAASQLAAGGNVVLFLDEAHELKKNTFGNLYRLSNTKTADQELVQILLSGQPKLDAMLNHPNLTQLSKSIRFKGFLESLKEAESYAYIDHRLGVVGYRGHPLYDSDSLKLIWQYSLGIPRKINRLCHNSLIIGYARGKRRIDQDIVKEAIRDLKYRPFDESADNDAFKYFRKKAALL